MTSATNTPKTVALRQNLHNIAQKLLEELSKKHEYQIANLHGIRGMGKTLFLKDIFIPLLDSKKIIHPELIEIPEPQEQENTVIEISRHIAKWIYSNLINSKDADELPDNLDGLENEFNRIREILIEKGKHSFAVLVDNANNLPFDDLDWFQANVLETISSAAGSIIVLTSQSELNWHSWEMRNKCNSIKLPVFTEEELLDLCESFLLAKKVSELSAGHPKTVQALVNIAQSQLPKKDLSSLTIEDIESLNEPFYKRLKTEIDETLTFKGQEWLSKVFLLTSVADEFDADLVSDIVSGYSAFNKKETINIPEEITDIAWEMAHTGLVAWDFDEKSYKMVFELRKRIIQYIKNKNKDDFALVLEVIGNSYRLRAEILPDWSSQLIKYIRYIEQARNIQGESSNVLGEIKSSIDEFLNTTDDYAIFSQAIERENANNPTPLLQKLLHSFYLTSASPPANTSNRGKEDSVNENLSLISEVITDATSRDKAKEYFFNLINKKLGEKWILHINGEAGIGKTHLLNSLKAIAQKENHAVIQIDLHYPENRNAIAILREISKQAEVDKEENVKIAFASLQDHLTNISREKHPYMATDLKQSQNEPAIRIINAIKQALNKQQKHPIIILDTIDNTPSINQLARWFILKLLSELKQSATFVLAGRKPIEEIIRPGWNLGILSIPLGPLNEYEIREVVDEMKTDGFGQEILESVIKVSNGNPLTLHWILFYLKEFKKDQEWLAFIKDKPQRKILDDISDEFWHDQGARIAKRNIVALRVGLRAAAHFGSHFNIDLFRKAVPESKLENTSHEEIFKTLDGFFYIRGSSAHWTLHDQVREWLLKASSLDTPLKLTELTSYSENALNHYYIPEIQKCTSIENRSSEEQDKLDELKAQMFYHRLFVETKRGHTALTYHYDLWNHLDDLWHRYRIDQMVQVIHFGGDVRKWKVEADKDVLLGCILNAAHAWAYYSLADYSEASKYANAVLKTDFAPRRLKATASVVLGLIPTEDPERAIRKYLGEAKAYYEQILEELESSYGKLSDNEFTDAKVEIYPELHQVYMSIGRMQLIHSFDMEKGKEAFKNAYDISRKPDWWHPLYSAVALNEWARILRFQGDFTEALNKVMLAISIYKRDLQNPQADANYGYFYETLALICKELGHFDLALNALDVSSIVYNNISNLIDTRKATIPLERGHIYVLSQQSEKAKELLDQAHEIFDANKDKNPWYYLNSLEKLGEYYMATGNITEAKNRFREQIKLAQKYNHYLWIYRAEQHIAEIDYEDTREFNRNHLESLLDEYSNRLKLQLGPAFWQTKRLFYKITKEKDEDIASAITHLAQGLTYLVEHWRAQYWQGLLLLRIELISLDINTLNNILNQLANLWKHRFPEFKNDSATNAFIDMCDSLRDAIN